MKLDYDNEGWRIMEHADDRSLATYIGQFEERDNSLTANSAQTLFLGKNCLFKDKSRQKAYIKVE